MANFETIVNHRDASVLRVIVVALEAHGFHPLEDGLDGLPGMPGIVSPGGAGIRVPGVEAEDARMLAEALLKQMRAA